MDVARGAKKVFVAMEHVDRYGKPKILKECTIPITTRGVVNMIFTNLAVIEVTKKGLLLKEIAPGFTHADIQEATGANLAIDPQVRSIDL